MDLQTIQKYQEDVASAREQYRKIGDSIRSIQTDLVAAVNLYADTVTLSIDQYLKHTHFGVRTGYINSFEDQIEKYFSKYSCENAKISKENGYIFSELNIRCPCVRISKKATEQELDKIKECIEELLPHYTIPHVQPFGETSEDYKNQFNSVNHYREHSKSENLSNRQFILNIFEHTCCEHGIFTVWYCDGVWYIIKTKHYSNYVIYKAKDLTDILQNIRQYNWYN